MRIESLRNRNLPWIAALLLCTGVAPGAAQAFGGGHDGHGSAVHEQLLVHVAVVEPTGEEDPALTAFREANTAKEVASTLEAAMEGKIVTLLGSRSAAAAYNFPVRVDLSDGSQVHVRPLDRHDNRKIRTLVTERRDTEHSEKRDRTRIVEVPLNRSTALPTGGIVLPLDDGDRLLAIRVEVRN